MYNIHTMEYYSAIKRKMMPFVATWMDLEIIILSEEKQMEKDKYHITYKQNVKNYTNGLIYKAEIDPQTQKKIYGY